MLLCSRSSEFGMLTLRARRSRELSLYSTDSRMQHPRYSAMNWSSHEDNPSKNRRVLPLRGLSTHDTRAITRVRRTADLLTKREAYEAIGSGGIITERQPGGKGCTGEVGVGRQAAP